MLFFKDDTNSTILLKAFCERDKTAGISPIEANTVEASREKHLPEVTVEGAKITVKVGSVEHPMTEAHYIAFIALETEHGFAVRKLNPADKPEAFFCIDKDDKAEAVYAYCNLHGLWKTSLN